MPLIDRGGESSIVELETRGLCLPDERAILLGASRYPPVFRVADPEGGNVDRQVPAPELQEGESAMSMSFM
jgi:hypothetical protein